MKKFLSRMIMLAFVSIVSLATIAIVVSARLIAYAGTRFVLWCAERTGTESPFNIPSVATNSAPRNVDYAAIENLINSKIPSKAERAAARAALQQLMSP